MKRALLLLSALALFPQAVSAKTQLKLFGNLAGAEYCRMRAVGVSHNQALDVAISENISSTMREPVITTGGGTETTIGTLDMIDYIDARCPGQWPKSTQSGTI